MNPIAPELMKNDSFAREFAFTILANLNPSMIKKPDFWSDNSTALLASTFWYLKKRHSQYCTLPHAISMILQPDLEALLKTLSEEPKCADMIAPILTAYANKADNQLAGVIASLQVALSKINTEEVYYITSASDLSLDLNNPASRGILCIGNDPVLAGTYSPVIGLMLTAISKILNQQGKEKSVFMIDEFPTVFVPNIEQLPATARSNKVATVLACQDIAQIVDKYGKEKADTILSNLGNQFYGRTTNPATAQRVSQMFGKADKLMMTESQSFTQTSILGGGNNTTGQSYSYQERDLVKQQDVATLPTGDFYAILSEGQHRQGRAHIDINPNFNKSEIKPFRTISELDLEENFNKIKRETGEILIK
jgi:type IV secretory pathway TraG/TraD family ATPase VirD4